MKRIHIAAVAVAALVSSSVAYSNDSEASFASGQARARTNDLAGAQIDLEAAVSMSPANTEYLSALGVVYLRTGQSAAAARTYERMCGIIESSYGLRSSRVFGCHTLWALALSMSNDLSGAAEKHRTAHAAAMAQDPRSYSDCLMSLHSLAATLRPLNRLHEAEPLYEQLLEVTPKGSRYYGMIESSLRAVREGKLPPRL